MADARRVLWSEGMLLTPQHFQQWDRHHDHVLAARLSAGSRNAWGVTQLSIDTEALAGAEARVTACSGVLRNGLFFDAPDRDPLPRARSFKEAFDPRASELGVWIGVARPTAGLVCADGDGAASAPYRRQPIEVADETKPSAERQIDLAILDLKVLFDTDPLDDYEALRIAEIRPSTSGSYELVDAYVPPCLSVACSSYLGGIQRRLLEMLSNRSETLAGQQRASGGMAEALDFWLLHTVNSYLPVLAHLFRKERAHPEELYLALAQLGGELCTFVRDQHPRHLPAYEHGDLRATFRSLEEKVAFLLGGVKQVNVRPIALERLSASTFAGAIGDDDLLQQAQFFLAVRAQVEDGKLEREIPAKAKVTSRDRLPQLVQMMVPGLKLHHVPTPPSDIPMQSGNIYFRLEKAGAHWDAIAMSHTISCHIPPQDFPELHVELVAVKEPR